MSSEKWVRLPVIDFSNQDLKPGTPEWDVLKLQVREALAKYSCFEASTDRLKEVGKPFIGALEEVFDLPLETKKLFVSESYFAGYKKEPMNECFEIENWNVDEEKIQQSLTNILWPHGNPSFSKTLLCFTEHASKIDKIIRTMILESFGVDDKHVKEHIDLTKHTVKLLKFEGQPQSNDDQNLGAHYDPTSLSVLYQNEVDGLEIRINDGEWMKIKRSSPNSFIIMVGEALSVLLNGRLPCTYHRVRKEGNNKTRYSTAFFSIPKGGCKVKVPEEVVDEEHPLLFKPFDYDEFWACFISNISRGMYHYNLKTYCAV